MQIESLSARERAILTSVIYSSLFQYPQTAEELSTSLPGETLSPDDIKTTFSGSEALQRLVECRDGYYFPKGQYPLVRLRRWRRRHSRKCLERCSKMLRLIPLFPFTRLVALSGSSAHLNMGRAADLDFFIVTHGHTVWSVTVLSLILARLLGCRRWICLNYLISDRELKLDNPDIFTANQVLHLKTLIGEDVFVHLLEANPFIAEFYPAADPSSCSPAWLERWKPSKKAMRIKRIAESILSLGPIQLFEPLARFLYRRHLLRNRDSWQTPSEVRLEEMVLKLHTHSHRKTIEHQLNESLRRVLDGS